MNVNTAKWWLRQNLFPTLGQSICSIVILIFLAWAAYHIFNWAIIEATFSGESLKSCETKGACWAMVGARWEQFLYGFYPQAERWRINLAFILFLLGFLFVALYSGKFKIKLTLVILDLIAIYMLMVGGYFNLPVVNTDQWGGLSLTLVLAFGGILGAFPLALLLALGRHSQLAFVKVLCVFFIEAIRGVPLISVLFMASFMLPLFLPEGVNFDKLLRALVGIMLFQAAYLAEVIRGGLNAVPKGQVEASLSLGLNYWQTMGHIVLPQALRVMIPGIVNTFIALFKDTTLVLIIGLFDFLGIVQSALTNPKWIGGALEAYIFCAGVYWVFCYSMSAYSQHLEVKLKVKK